MAVSTSEMESRSSVIHNGRRQQRRGKAMEVSGKRVVRGLALLVGFLFFISFFLLVSSDQMGDLFGLPLSKDCRRFMCCSACSKMSTFLTVTWLIDLLTSRVMRMSVKYLVVWHLF